MRERDRRIADRDERRDKPLRDPAELPSVAEPETPGATIVECGGSFVVDEGGTLLAFDAGMERLTGWDAFEVVGRHKDLGLYRPADECGLRGFDLRALYEGRLAWVPHPETRELVVTRKDGVCLVVEATVAPVPGRLRRLSVHVHHLIERHGNASLVVEARDLDPITRLPRGGVFLERLDQALERAHAERKPLSVLIADVDQLEDTDPSLHEGLRHEALRTVSGILQASVREEDLVTRVRDDDFALLLHAANRGDARLIGGRIRRSVERLLVRGPRHAPYRVTVSIGAACYPADGTSARDLVVRAREALAEARRLGRNRVWCYVRRPRINARFPVFYDGPAGSLVGVTHDISDSGLFVETSELLPIGTRLAMALELDPGPRLVRLVGRIARQVMRPEEHSAGPGLGIEFESFPPESRRELEAFLHAVALKAR